MLASFKAKYILFLQSTKSEIYVLKGYIYFAVFFSLTIEMINIRIRKKKKVEKERQIILIDSFTSNALQKNWKTPTEFPNCPSQITNNALKLYSDLLVKNTVFCKNKYGVGQAVYSDFNKSSDELFGKLPVFSLALIANNPISKVYKSLFFNVCLIL